MASAQMGLEPDGIHAALVPYGRECTLVPMFQGLLTLAWRSGLVKSIEVEVVREKDYFEYQRGTEAVIRHVPHWPTKEAGEPRATYAIAHMTNGGTVMTVMDMDQIDDVRPKHGRKTPWDDPKTLPEMLKKSALRRLCKLLPKSAELSEAITFSDAYESGKPPLVEIPHVEKDPVPTDDDLEAAFAELNDCETPPDGQAWFDKHKDRNWTDDQHTQLHARYTDFLEAAQQA